MKETIILFVPRWRPHFAWRAWAVVCTAMFSLVCVSLRASPPAAAATICLNEANQFVPCYELPPGSGTPAPSTKASTLTPARSSPNPGIESAVAMVAVGLVVGLAIAGCAVLLERAGKQRGA